MYYFISTTSKVMRVILLPTCTGENLCLYGTCKLCERHRGGACATGTKLEGAVILWLPKNKHLTARLANQWKYLSRFVTVTSSTLPLN